MYIWIRSHNRLIRLVKAGYCLVLDWVRFSFTKIGQFGIPTKLWLVKAGYCLRQGSILTKLISLVCPRSSGPKIGESRVFNVFIVLDSRGYRSHKIGEFVFPTRLELLDQKQQISQNWSLKSAPSLV